jgi:hypothetical protein
LAAAVALAGPASAASLSFNPAPLNFGSVALTESKLMKATLTNGTALNVNLGGVRLIGTNVADFTQTNDCPQLLPTGASCVFSVTFKPAVLTARSASLSLDTDDSTQPTLGLLLRGNLYPGALNDTGITTCGNAGANSLPCPVPGFSGQDAQYGRDRTRSNDANGHAGFNFTKLDVNGNALPANAKSWNCVRDNVTGRVWEKKPKGDGVVGNQGLHDADDSYSWYSTDAADNNGSAGYPNGNSCYGYNGAKAGTWCNSQAYVKRVNAQGWCGAKDWRMPSSQELESLVDFSIPEPGPTIDTKYFPDVFVNGHWSSSSDANYSDYVWIVHFIDGNSISVSRNNYYAVLLVRGGQ